MKQRFVVIIPPYVIDEEGKGIAPNTAMLPVGPLAILSAIREHGYDVKVIDLVFSREWEERSHAIENNNHILLSCHTVRNIEPCKVVLAALRARGFHGHVTLGGNACLELSQAEFAERGLIVDTVIRGYAHGLVDEIIAGVQGNLQPTNKATPLLPPAVDLLDEETHRQYLAASGGRYPMIGHGYGCAWACTYCTAKMGAGWSERPLQEVETEIALAKELGYRELWCVDNLFLVNPERALAFDRLVAESGLTWKGMDRAEQVVKHGKTLIKLVALKNIAMGVETVSRRQLKVFNRHDRPADYPRAFELVRSAGIATTAFVILDCPETDEKDFWKLHRLLKNDLRPTNMSWSFYSPPKDGGGFYRWPRGCSKVPPVRIIQQAMAIDNDVWQRGWTLKSNPFFEGEMEFGVHFEEGDILQPYSARSPIGDIWDVWEEESEG